MIDFHTHVLPRIDDGSSSSQMTIRMLEEELQQGVTTVVATPHFYAHKDRMERFLERRDASYGRVLELTANLQGLPSIVRGAEVFYFPEIGRAMDLRKLCIEGTDYLLLEMPFRQWDKEVVNDVTDILEKQKLHIILAHVDRYYGFQKNKKCWNEIMGLPLTPQINAEAYLNWRQKHFALKFMKEYPVLLGSDMHNLTSRAPNLREARDVIAKKSGEEMLTRIDDRGRKILGGEVA